MKKAKENLWGKRLGEILAEKKISLRNAAKKAGVAPSVLSNWLNGSSPTDLMAVKKLADELQVSFTWLMTGQHETGHLPNMSEMFDEQTYFDGLARIRIDRLIPKKGKG